MDRRVQVPYSPPAEPISLEPFQKSDALSLGVELELQLVNTHDYDLAPYSDEMLRLMSKYSVKSLHVKANGARPDSGKANTELSRAESNAVSCPCT